MFIAISTRLFYLQIIKHNYYLQIAEESHAGITKLPAKRGEILLQDPHSGAEYKLATTTTYDLLYADPVIISKGGNANFIAQTIGPLIFNLEKSREQETKRVKKLEYSAQTDEEKLKIQTKTDEELLSDYIKEITEQMDEYIRSEILLLTAIDPELEMTIKNLKLEGIKIDDEKNLYAYPKEINSPSKIAKQLYELINFDKDSLTRILEGKNHYSVLARKLSTQKSEEIQNVIKENSDKYNGLRIIKEHYRYYPEQELAAQDLGYVNSAGIGQYGIEGRFNHLLVGKAGFIESQKDAGGGILTVGDSKVQIAQDGSDITLTIDRAIQLELEKQLSKAVKDYQAESGQAIVMNPKTGEILALANYPTFNPNTYGEAFNLKEIEFSQSEIDNLSIIGEGEDQKIYFYKQRNPDVRFEVFQDPEIPNTYYRYDNLVGPEVYKNKAISDLYEPGSTFKVIVMSSAIDVAEVEPFSTHNCAGPIKVPKVANPVSENDYFTIKTYNNKYHGIETMTEVLQNSCNIGMSYVAEKLGDSLFYNYIKKFGYGQKTGIEFDNENTGQVEHYRYWDKSELLTKGFGQGISVTLMQHVTAISALANHGTLMQPFIVKKIDYKNGRIEQFEPQIISQVITKETADKITAMMISVIENGEGRRGQVNGHFIAGKTGTSQTYKNGNALFGPGTTIASFVAFAPVDNPEFVVMIKLDRPMVSEWGSSTAAVAAEKVFEFLFKYYNVPPDKKS